MNTIYLTFFTICFFISHALLCGEHYPPKPSYSLWHWDGPEWVTNVEYSDDETEGSNDNNEDDELSDELSDERVVIRGSRLFDFLEEPYEEIFLAIFYGNIEALNLLLEDKENLEFIGAENRYTPLFYAATIGRAEIVELLLKKDANCYIDGREYCSIAHFCIANKKPAALAVVLKYSKEFYSQLDYRGHTLLQCAVANADSFVFDVLLEYSDENGKSYLNFSHKDKQGYNALFNAAGNKNIGLLSLLIDRYHDQISNDDLVHEGKSIFHVILGNIGNTDRGWCPHLDELRPLVTHFYELLNYIDNEKHQTSLDILNNKIENCKIMLGRDNTELIEEIIVIIKNHGAKTAHDVRIFLIKSTSNHKNI